MTIRKKATVAKLSLFDKINISTYGQFNSIILKSIMGSPAELVKTEPMALLKLDAIKNAEVKTDPYPYLIASDVLPLSAQDNLHSDFPDFDEPGFFPLNMAKQKGAFAQLIADVQNPQYSALIGDMLGIELRDKPQMITIRKLSELKAGRIHNDSESKICTSLIYLNDNWVENEGGRLRVLRNENSFDNFAAEIPPVYGTLFAFKRTENSWHGHKPFEGERRVVQITWLRSNNDLARKEKRGNVTYLVKKLAAPLIAFGDFLSDLI